MAQEILDGKVVGSSGVAKAGLTLGIIGTGLAALGATNGLGGLFGNWGFGGNTPAGYTAMSDFNQMQSTISQLTAEKYADNRSFDLYVQLRDAIDVTDAKINAVATQLGGAINAIDKQGALTEQAARLNREYDNTVRDYMMTIVNNKIDCCCNKMELTAQYEKEISELADASILSYVNSNFLPGILKLPASNISPNVQLA